MSAAPGISTVEEIVARAEVSRRTFFRYFSSKDDVIFSNHNERLEHFRNYVRSSDNPSRIETVLQAFGSLAELFNDDDEVEQALINSSENLLAKELAHDRDWQRVISEELMRPGTGCVDRVDAQTAAAMIFSVILVILKEWRTNTPDEHLEKMRERPFEILLNGLNCLHA